MYQTAYHNKTLQQPEIYCKQLEVLRIAGDAVLNNHNYGVNKQPNIIKYLQAKNLLTLTADIKNTLLMTCCFSQIEEQKMLNLLYKIFN